MVLPYRGGYGPGQPGLARRIQNRYFENAPAYPARDSEYFRKEYDERAFLPHGEMPRPPSWNPIIDQQPLRPGDLMEGESSRQAPDPFGVNPFTQAMSENLPPAAGFGDIYDQMGETNRRNRGLGGLIRRVNPFDNAQPPAAAGPPQPFEGNLPRPRPTSWNEEPQETIGTHGGPTDLIVPPDKPQQDTQSVAAVFGSPQSGASSMAEDPRQKAARIAREAFGRDPSLIKEFMPKLQAVGVDPALGAPEGWSLPDTGTLTADDMAAPFMSSRPVGGQAQPLPPEPTDPWAAADADWRDWERRRDTNMVRPEGPPGGLPGQQQTQSVADIFSGGGAAPPAPYASLIAGRPAGPPSGLSQMTPNIPPARPDYQAPYSGPVPRDPLPRQTAALGAGERLPTPGMPRPRPEEFGPPQSLAGSMPAEFANLPNGPRDITRGLIAGGQEARLPTARPAQQSDIGGLPPDQRIAPFAGPAPPISPELAAGAARATRPTDPFLTGLPPLGAIDQTVQRAPAPPIDPAAIAEARQTLQLHPNAGRIRTAPGYKQYNEPARTRPVVGQPEAPLVRDLEAERNSPEVRARVAAEASQIARMPRPRPEEFGPPIDAMEAIGSDVPGPQSGLPTSVMESIYHPNYNPTASGGPATPEEEADAKERLGWVLPNDLIAKPAVGATNQGQPLPPPPETTVPPPIVEQQTIDDRPPLIASSSTYAGPTAKSRRTGFLGNLFDREHFVGGPGLTAAPSTVGTDYTKSAKPGRGKYKPAENERLARNIGKTAGLLTSVVGVPPAVGVPLFGAAGAMVNRAIDPNRQVIERGPLRFFGNIFGGGRGKDKKKNDANGTPPMDTRPAGVAESMGGNRGGLGSDRGGGGGYGGYGDYSGGTYGGYGGRYINEGVGGAYRNR